MTNPDSPTPTSTRDMLARTRRRAAQLRRRRWTVLSALALVVVAAIAVPELAATGHHGQVVGVTGTPTSVTEAPTAPTTPATTPTTATSPATAAVATTRPATTPTSATTVPARVTTTTGPVTAPGCTTSQLSASLANPSGAAGSVGYDLVLVNRGAVTCSLRGYPGVSYVTGATGATVGAPAQRDPVVPAVTVTLAPGHAAHALVIEVDSLNYPSDKCQLTAVGGVRIYPPNQTAALFVPQSTHACANPADNVLQVGPVQASASAG